MAVAGRTGCSPQPAVSPPRRARLGISLRLGNSTRRIPATQVATLCKVGTIEKGIWGAFPRQVENVLEGPMGLRIGRLAVGRVKRDRAQE